MESDFYLEEKMTDHSMHHMEKPQDHGVHGMLLFGEESLYLSHLPMFMPMHGYQVILEVTLDHDEGDAHDVYRADRRESGQRFYTFVPEEFSLQRLDAEGEHALRSFGGTVHRGHFEKGGPSILRDVTANVVNVIHFRKFNPDADAPTDLQYLLFGRDDELYMAHLINKPPDFDQIVPVASISHRFSKEALRRGVRLSIPERDNRVQARLREGEPAAAHVEVTVETAAEVYLEEGELSTRATFDTTAEEEDAGFQ